jgi:uncharacterized YccA/Bax inhibitor family protein
MRTNNPALNERVFDQAGHAIGAGAMTVNGTVTKTGFLSLLLVAAGAWSWSQITGNTAPAWFGSALKFGWILPLITALVISFVPRTAPWLSPVYAVTKGAILGIISAYFENLYNGIVFTSVLLTLGVLFALLGAYLTGVIRATPMFRKIVIGATLGIFIFYLASFVLGLFGIQIPGLFGNGLMGIGFSLFVVVIAAMNLVLDFDFIEQGAAARAPKYMEWYGAFGLLVTLVWLYLEILRLLAKLRGRD